MLNWNSIKLIQLGNYFSSYQLLTTINVFLLTIFQGFDFLTCSPSSKWIPNKLRIVCLIVSHTLFAIYFSQIHMYKSRQSILVSSNVSIFFFNDEAIKDDHINWKKQIRRVVQSIDTFKAQYITYITLIY